MLTFLRTRKRALHKAIENVQDRRRRRLLSPMYQPDSQDLDRTRHLLEAMEWLKRAQDAGTDHGVSYGVRFGDNFDVSYPETTGYICQTFVDQALRTGSDELLGRAIKMGDWEITIQLPDGSVMGGKLNSSPTPAVFNTGMVLLGWSSLISQTGESRFRSAAARASEWLLSIQEPDGQWLRWNSQFANHRSTMYNVMAAWGLCSAGFALNDRRFIQAAVKNAEYCLSRQHENGWLPDCCLTEMTDKPLLHTLAYAMQGLLGIGVITERADLIHAARKLADAELQLLSADGHLPGRQTCEFSPAAEWCCLTGSAQTSAVWSQLYLLTQQERYRAAVRCVNDYLLARHDIRNVDLRLRGGVSGSWPTWGAYGPYQILNWATKFLVDALALEIEIFNPPVNTASAPHSN